MKLKTLALVALASLPLSAVADTVVITGFTYNPAETVTVATPSYSGPAGQFSGTIDGNAFTTFCTELTQTLNFGNPYEYTVVDGATAWGADKAEDLNKLFTAAIYSGLPNDAVTSALIQVMVWEILYENSGTYSFFSGDFVVSGASPELVLAMNAIIWQLLDDVVATVSVSNLANASAQDLLIIGVPEPETLALMGLGLLAIGLRTRRRTR